MPFVMKGEVQGSSSTSGTQSNTLVGKDTGGDKLTVVEAGIDPGAGLALHIHPSVEIEVLGDRIIIPANMGITNQGMRAIHTHNFDGVLHVESPYPHQFYLADFFKIWGRNFNPQCIFEHCSDQDHSLKVYVNDIESNLIEDLPLVDKERIKIVYKKNQ